MTRPIIKIADVTTGQEIEREMNDAEFAQYEIDNEEAISEQLKAEAKAAARQVILDRLGLNEEEARLLLG